MELYVFCTYIFQLRCYQSHTLLPILILVSSLLQFLLYTEVPCSLRLFIVYLIQIPAPFPTCQSLTPRRHLLSSMFIDILTCTVPLPPCDMNTVSAAMGRVKRRATVGCDSRASPKCCPGISGAVQGRHSSADPCCSSTGQCELPHTRGCATPVYPQRWPSLRSHLEKEPATFSPAPCSKCSVCCCMSLSGFCPSVKLPVL